MPSHKKVALFSILFWLVLFVASGIVIYFNLFPLSGILNLRTDFYRPAKFLSVPKIGDWALEPIPDRYNPIRQKVVGENIYIDLTTPLSYKQADVIFEYLGDNNSFDVGIMSSSKIQWNQDYASVANGGQVQTSATFKLSREFWFNKRFRFVIRKKNNLKNVPEIIDAKFRLYN